MASKKEEKAEVTEVKESQKTFDIALAEKLDTVVDALPMDFNKARFVQNALALLNDHPELTKYGAKQCMNGLMRGAYLGLDFISSECYLVPYGNQLQYQTSYIGAIKLVKKYAIRPVRDIYAKLVRQGDEFVEEIIDGHPSISFKPKAFNEGAIIGAFAVCLFEDGAMQYETMSITELENTRKSSKAAHSPAWERYTGEMYKKVCIRRLCKTIETEFENPKQKEIFESDTNIDLTQDKHEVFDPSEEDEKIVAEVEVTDGN